MMRGWAAVHKWTSLACTLFLLMLCMTGLPLVFRDEIEDAISGTIAAPPGDETRPPASLDRMVATARERYPGEYVRVLSWEEEGAVVRLSIVPTADAPSSRVHRLSFDARSGAVLGIPALRRGTLSWLAGLHRDLLSGLAGSLILGAMGLLFVASLVSGLVLYAPYMQRLAFGEVRRDRARRIRWLDLHNLIGIATVTWALVVGLTGAMNTVSIPLFANWRTDVLAELLAPYRGAPPLGVLASVDDAVAAARAARPGSEIESVIFPNNRFGSPRHYLIWTRGAMPLTSKVVAPVLVDAETNTVSLARPLPWHLQALQVSRPLHFGDYGGLPLKGLWGLLDLAAIVVLASGVYLWLARKAGT